MDLNIVTNVLHDRQCSVRRSNFASCNFTEAKSRKVCTVLLKKELVVKYTQIRLTLEYLVNSRSPVSFVALGCLDDQILARKFTEFKCVCITSRTRYCISFCCEELVECLSFHVPYLAAVYSLCH